MRLVMNLVATKLPDVAGIFIQAIALSFLTKRLATVTAGVFGTALVARERTNTTFAKDHILPEPVAALLAVDVLAQQRAAVSTTRQIATTSRDVVGRPQSH